MSAVDELASQVGDFAGQLIRDKITQGWQDDEIMDDLDRVWNRMGHLYGGPGPRVSPRAGAMPLRVRRLATKTLAELRRIVSSAISPAPRPRGRSRWTDDLFAARWVAACERSGAPYTYPHVAPEFEWLDNATRIGADPDYLGRLWRNHGRPEPAP